MFRYAAALLSAPLLAIPLASATAAEIQIPVSGPVVELTVSEAVKSKPDIATIGTGVTTLAPTAVEAMQQNAQAMTKVIDKLKKLGIAADDIQTSGISLYAQYDYDQDLRKQVFRGYQASNRVSVTLRDIARTGQVLDTIVATGATDIDGPNFALADNTAALASARKAAMLKASAQAKAYAEMSGYSGIRLLEINETVQSGTPQPFPYVQMEAADAKSTPVEPGLVGSNVTITVKYELVNG